MSRLLFYHTYVFAYTHTLSRCLKLALGRFTTQKEHYNDTAATFLLTEAAAAPLDTLSQSQRSGNGKTAEKCRRSAAVYK
jgi:hypothetical protein